MAAATKDPLLELSELLAQKADLSTRIDEMLVEVRADGWTWDEIASVLGMSRPAAIKYHRRVTARTQGDDIDPEDKPGAAGCVS